MMEGRTILLFSSALIGGSHFTGSLRSTLLRRYVGEPMLLLCFIPAEILHRL